MEWPEEYFCMLYRLIRKQNDILLREISIREGVSLELLRKDFLPSRAALRNFTKHHRTFLHIDHSVDHHQERNDALLLDPSVAQCLGGADFLVAGRFQPGS